MTTTQFFLALCGSADSVVREDYLAQRTVISKPDSWRGSGRTWISESSLKFCQLRRLSWTPTVHRSGGSALRVIAVEPKTDRRTTRRWIRRHRVSHSLYLVDRLLRSHRSRRSVTSWLSSLDSWKHVSGLGILRGTVVFRFIMRKEDVNIFHAVSHASTWGQPAGTLIANCDFRKSGEIRTSWQSAACKWNSMQRQLLGQTQLRRSKYRVGSGVLVRFLWLCGYLSVTFAALLSTYAFPELLSVFRQQRSQKYTNYQITAKVYCLLYFWNKWASQFVSAVMSSISEVFSRGILT